MGRRVASAGSRPDAGRVQTKRIQDPASPADGTRVLVMRLWPRGTRKAAVDVWLKGLGAPLALLRRWKSVQIPWAAFAAGYREHLKRPEARVDLPRLLALARQGPVTLLCTCPDEARCHRGILKRVVREALRRS